MYIIIQFQKLLNLIKLHYDFLYFIIPLISIFYINNRDVTGSMLRGEEVTQVTSVAVSKLCLRWILTI